ncbi:MAG: type II toxin-antitoxin system VapC family toxin [Candidatus Njordarchaeota archaeon]
MLDTSYVIKLIKQDTLIELSKKYDLYITIINLYELVRGDVLAGFDAKDSKKDYEKVFMVLHFDNRAMIKASEIYAVLRRKGKLIDERDLMVGAICLSNNLPLATLNKKHFDRLKQFGLKLVDI